MVASPRTTSRCESCLRPAAPAVVVTVSAASARPRKMRTWIMGSPMGRGERPARERGVIGGIEVCGRARRAGPREGAPAGPPRARGSAGEQLARVEAIVGEHGAPVGVVPLRARAVVVELDAV